ncbi:hypothetical protein WDU94_001037 [Cyamophila willieti]
MNSSASLNDFYFNESTSGGGNGSEVPGGINTLWPQQTPRPEMKFIELLQLYYTPLLVGLGSIGNILSVFVFFGTKLRKLSSSYYLSALASSDTGFLVTLFAVWLNMIDVPWFTNDGICQISIYLTYNGKKEKIRKEEEKRIGRKIKKGEEERKKKKEGEEERKKNKERRRGKEEKERREEERKKKKEGRRGKEEKERTEKRKGRKRKNGEEERKKNKEGRRGKEEKERTEKRKGRKRKNGEEERKKKKERRRGKEEK